MERGGWGGREEGLEVNNNRPVSHLKGGEALLLVSFIYALAITQIILVRDLIVTEQVLFLFFHKRLSFAFNKLKGISVKQITPNERLHVCQKRIKLVIISH